MEIFDERWRASLSGENKQYTEFLINNDKQVGSFLEINPEKGMRLAEKKGRLAGIPFGVKDNLAVESFKLSCGSKILENLISPYTATAVKKLISEGGIVAGKTNLDEFGMGSSTDNSALQVTNNPWDMERVAGGSSGGSAAAVAAGLVPFALGTDTGGSVRQPASFCGVYGLKPTYGVVSRYGLTAYASSLDVVGVISKTAAQCRLVFNIMKGQDERDNTSVVHPGSNNGGNVSSIGVLKIPARALNPEVEKSYQISVERLKKLGYQIREISINSLEYVVPSYYTIATAEASANLARYTGIRYGYRYKNAGTPSELMEKTRDEGFGDEVKLRILLGTYVLRSGFQDQYYHRAQKIRTAIKNEFDIIFKDVDLILMPVFPTPAFKHGESDLDPFQQKVADKYTCVANLTGFPAITIPSSVEDGLPAGVQLIAPAFEEDRLFNVAEETEKIFSSPDSAAALTFLERVLISDFTVLLRAARFSS